MEPAGSGATWTLARRVSIGQCESTRVARSECVEVISNVEAQWSAVRSIARLGRAKTLLSDYGEVFFTQQPTVGPDFEGPDSRDQLLLPVEPEPSPRDDSILAPYC
jgi:hypothetical protein